MKAEKRRDYKLAIALGFGSGLRISEIIGQKKKYSKCCDVPIIVEVKIEKMTERNVKRVYQVCGDCKKIMNVGDEYESRKELDWRIPPLMRENVNLKTHQIKVIQGKGKKDRITTTSPWLTMENLSLLPISIKTRTLQDRFGKLCKKVLGKHCNFHMLRHGFGNFMHVEKGVPLTVLQQLMGHTRSDVTAQYARANPEEAVRQAWEAF